MDIITYDTKISIPGDAEYMTGLINVCFVFAKQIVSDNFGFIDVLRYDEGLTLETSWAFETLYGGQFTFSTQLIKPS